MSVTIDSSLRIQVTSGSATVNAPTVVQMTTDDVLYATDTTQTVSDRLALLQPIIGTGAITANQNDVNILNGANSGGVILADLTKLHAVTAAAADLNACTSAASNFQTQINALKNGIKLLGSNAAINGKTTGVTALYTVPAGKTAVITQIVVTAVAITVGGGTVSALVDFGYTTNIEFVSTAAHGTLYTGLSATRKVVTFGAGDNPWSTVGAGYVALPTGQAFNTNVRVASDYTTQTLAIHVFGYEF